MNNECLGSRGYGIPSVRDGCLALLCPFCDYWHYPLEVLPSGDSAYIPISNVRPGMAIVLARMPAHDEREDAL